MIFSLTVLGSSSALPTSKRFPSAHVLNVHEHFFLIDCGEGTQIQLRRFKIKFSRIDHIFISHLHGDHVLGLPGLLSTFSLLGRKNDLFIHAHLEIKHLIEFFLKYFGQDLTFTIHIVPFKTKKNEIIYEDKNVTVWSLPLKHRVPSSGFLFIEKEKPRNIIPEMIKKYSIPIKDIVRIKSGEDFYTDEGTIPNKKLTYPPFKIRSYAYCSDTAYQKNLPDLVKNVTLLYHEATFLQRDKGLARLTMHSTTHEAATIAKEAGAEKLLIGHFSSRYKNTDLFESEAKEIFLNTEAVEDGKEYAVELKRVIRD